VAPPPEPAPVRPFTPSQPAADEAPLPPPGPGQAAAAARGRLIHRLFEKLPAVSPDARTAVADRVIAAAGMVGADATAVRDEVLAVLADPSFAPLFHAQALAEAPIAGEVDGHVVSGTVDRLLATDALVRVADFKTGLVVPAAAADVHRSHLRQMAAYRAVLRAAFPGKRVEAALVYTAGPKLLLLPDEILDAHWPPAVP
jgi:ATP-dependent helicase/nuclease subunit A